jgi:hypothetical protein
MTYLARNTVKGILSRHCIFLFIGTSCFKKSPGEAVVFKWTAPREISAHYYSVSLFSLSKWMREIKEKEKGEINVNLNLRGQWHECPAPNCCTYSGSLSVVPFQITGGGGLVVPSRDQCYMIFGLLLIFPFYFLLRK